MGESQHIMMNEKSTSQKPICSMAQQYIQNIQNQARMDRLETKSCMIKL